MKDATAKAIICAAIGNIIWGFGFLFTKIALNRVPHPNLMLSHRFVIASLLMLIPALMGKVKISLRGKDLKPIWMLTATQIGYYMFESYAIMYTNASVSGMVLALVPVVSIGTGMLFLKEYPTRRQALFCLMPVAGAILITISESELGVISALGMLFLAATLIISALYKTVNRKASVQFSAYERTIIVLSASAVFYSAIGLGWVNWDIKAYAAPLLDIPYLLSLLCLWILRSIIANLLVNYATANMSVFKVSSFGALSTLCSAVAGVVLLDEPWNWTLLLGGVLILVGVRQVTRQK